MKLSDYVALFFQKKNIQYSFGVTGGASLHLIESFAQLHTHKFIPMHHEQSAAMAADGYARAKGCIGLAIGTSGPGATNLITGIAGAYYDSVPTFFITGQVTRGAQKGNLGVRQFGFQETPIVDMCKKITKYSVQINDPSLICTELEKAYAYATTGRMGPVLIDIPDDVQRANIEINQDDAFNESINSELESVNLNVDYQSLIDKLTSSKRPLLVVGWGVNLCGMRQDFLRLVDELGVPVVMTWGGADLLPGDHPMRVGTFGTHGTRPANFAIQNADFLLCIGTRMDTKAIGAPYKSFSPGSWKVIVDIDQSELNKFEFYGIRIDQKINADLRDVIRRLLIAKPKIANIDERWKKTIDAWKAKFILPEPESTKLPGINPYLLVDLLSQNMATKTQIFVDTGCSVAWLLQGIKPINGVRIWHDFNNTAMGWAVPAAIGGALANPSNPTICIVGDGSLMMNIQELSTIISNELKILVICFDNNGYSMIKRTQDQWLKGSHIGSSSAGGLFFPGIIAVSKSFGFDDVFEVSTMHQLEKLLTKEFLSKIDVPTFINVKINEDHGVVPRARFGVPNYDMEPRLTEEEISICLKNLKEIH